MEYKDEASGFMEQRADGSGAFVRVLLRPRFTIAAGSDPVKAKDLHHKAHKNCFIANSVNFAVELEPEINSSK